MARTLTDLYTSRCVKTEKGYTPHFWKPMELKRKPLCLFGDETKTFTPETERDVLGIMRRLIALGLDLEIPVGQFVLEQTRGEYPDAPYVKELLKSAVADEARHEQGFKFAATAYGLPDQESIDKSTALKDTWVALSNKYQPLAVAAALEQEVFLVTLGLMRILGGSSLNDLAIQIAKDESRHVATNRAISKWLGVTFDKDIEEAVDATLDYALNGFSLKVSPSLTVNTDFCIKSSRELRETGTAKKLDQFTRIASHRMPFELSNKALYTSRQTEGGETVY